MNQASPAGGLRRRVQGVRWFVAETESKKEMLAVQNLKRQSFHCFCPRIQRKRRHARTTKMIFAPLFPGYVFVRFDAEHDGWRAINGTFGVRRLLTSEKAAPMPMPDEAMASLLAKYRDEASPSPPDLQAGDAVLIVSGPFADQCAKVEALDDNGRVRLLFDILGDQRASACRPIVSLLQRN